MYLKPFFRKEMIAIVLNKTLISLSDGSYMTWKSGSWRNMGNSSPSENDFILSGINDISSIPQHAWLELSFTSPTIQLITYVPKNDSLDEYTIVYNDISADIEVSALPLGQVIVDKRSFIPYGNLSNILGNRYTGDSLPEGIIRFFLSFDNGVTWHTFKSKEWKEISLSDSRESIILNGLTFNELSSIQQADYEKMVSLEKGTIKLSYYIEEDKRDIDSAKIDSVLSTQNAKICSPVIEKASLYILNTASTINLSLANKRLKGDVSDIDFGKIRFKITLNGYPYYPKDGGYTDFQKTPLPIDIRIDNDLVKVDEENTIRVDFEDYWGVKDYWSDTFIGTYNGLLFKSPVGEYYSDDIGRILKYLDVGTLIAGQKTEEYEIHVANTMGYDVENVKLITVTDIEGIEIELSKTQSPFLAEKDLMYNQVLNDGDVLKFYLRISTKLGTPPISGGNFQIRVVADRI